MPEFTYTARTSDGRSREGVLVSSTAGDVVTDLRGRGWVVLDVQAVENAAQSLRRIGPALNPANWLRATRFDVELGMLQMATMIRSGLTLLSSIKTAAEQVRRPAMRRAMDILIGTLIVLIVLLVMHRVKATRLWMDRALLRIPITGSLLRLAGTASISRALSLLLQNDITLLNALETVRDLLANRAMRQRSPRPVWPPMPPTFPPRGPSS